MYTTYTVYDNATNKIVAKGTYDFVEKYLDNPDYTVVSDLNGMFL
jgi:hypothetical protein